MSRRKPKAPDTDTLTIEAVRNPALGVWIMTTTLGETVLETRHIDGTMPESVISRVVKAQREMVKTMIGRMADAQNTGVVASVPRQHGNRLPPVTVIK